MLQLARLTDYGIVLMTHLASSPSRRFSSTELAQATHLPGPTVSKVLKKLAREGLLESQRGADGGYALARDPAEITVAEVIAVLEGPIALTVCSEGAGACDLEPYCQVGPNWQLISDAVRGTLENITIAQMVRPVDPDHLRVPKRTNLTLVTDETEPTPTRSP